MAMGRSGLEKRLLIWLACWDVGVRASRLVGRLERGSEEVGMDSGMGSDIGGGGRKGGVVGGWWVSLRGLEGGGGWELVD